MRECIESVVDYLALLFCIILMGIWVIGLMGG